MPIWQILLAMLASFLFGAFLVYILSRPRYAAEPSQTDVQLYMPERNTKTEPSREKPHIGLTYPLDDNPEQTFTVTALEENGWLSGVIAIRPPDGMTFRSVEYLDEDFGQPVVTFANATGEVEIRLYDFTDVRILDGGEVDEFSLKFLAQ